MSLRNGVSDFRPNVALREQSRSRVRMVTLMLSISNEKLSLLRRVGGLLIALGSVVVWLTMGSPEKSDEGYASDIHAAMFGDRLNQKTADSAPQQQVVNGWTARDLLAISARIQAANTRDDDRIGAELMLLILAVAWSLLTSPRQVEYSGGGEARGVLSRPSDERPVEDKAAPSPVA